MSVRHRLLGQQTACSCAITLVIAACSADSSNAPSSPGSGGSVTDSGAHVDSGGTTTGMDAGEAGSSADAAALSDVTGGGNDGTATDASDGSAPVEAAVAFCSSHTGLAFCADFDSAEALEPGGAGWDFVLNSLVGTPKTNSLAASSVRSVSTPQSLLVTMVSGGGDAKVAKTITQPIAAATYEYDIYVAQLPKAATGTFASDFQFTDTNASGNQGADQFGFRVALFAKPDGSFDRAEVQHNAPALANTPDSFYTFPMSAGAWHHLRFAAAFSAAPSSDGGAAGKVSFQTYVDGSTTPAVDVSLDSPFVTAPFARISAGIVYAFNGNAKDYVLSYDNVTLKLQ